MAKLLVQYGKTGPLKFLSHLEILRAFERSFRRAHLDIKLSGGFNPRPKVSYGPALSVGVSSRAEFMTLDLGASPEPDELLKIISSVLPEGLSVYRAKYIPDKCQSIMSAVQGQAYSIKALCSQIDRSIGDAITNIRNEERLLVRRKEKEKWVETRKAILDWRVAHREGDAVTFYLFLSSGDSDAIRPEVAMDKFAEKLPDNDRCEVVEICRIGQYVNRDIPLIDIYDFYEGVTMGSECN